MADTASPILLLRIQSVGSNVNLWGGYINTALLTQERASKGYEALAVTGDATISWTNYSNSNTGSVALLKLTGSVTGTLTFPSYQNYLAVWNANSASVTIKCSGGTGVTMLSGQRALLYCDGTDYYNAGPTVAPTTTQSSASNAYALWGAVQSAIATASLPATAGTVLVSGTDTTAGYLASKLTVGFSSATTTQLAGLLSAQVEIDSAGSNEKARILMAPGYVAGYLDGGRQDTAFTASAGYSYNIVSGCTFILPSAPTHAAKMRIALFNPNANYGINPNGNKINNSTATLSGIPGGQTFELTYDATLGDWE